MLNKLEKALGYKFRDPELLRMALTHTSCANEIYQDPLRSYERLEFLGDSIVGFVTAEYLYRTFPKKLEGDLTRIRAELVCEKSLAAVAERLSLGEHLLLGNGEDQSGGRRRPCSARPAHIRCCAACAPPCERPWRCWPSSSAR